MANKLRHIGLAVASFILVCLAICCLNPNLQSSYADEASLSSTSISVSVNSTGSSDGTSASLDRTFYESGDTAILSWKGTTSGNNFVIPTSVRYGNRTIAVSQLIEADCIQSENSEYERRMNSAATMADYTTLKSYVDRTHTLSLGTLTTDTIVTVTWQKVEPVYRLYNMLTSEHLFTTNKTEYDNFVKRGELDLDVWIGEGISWLAPESGEATVHRLYNAGLGATGSSSHYYSADVTEISSLLRQGWTDDGEENQFQSGGNTAIYTCYNQALGSAHHYTSSKSEWESLEANGWNLEREKNGTDGVFRGVVATSWNFDSNFYKVEHVLDGAVKDTQFRSGIAGERTQAVAKAYPGYKSGVITSTTIAANNSTVVHVNYTEQSYTVTFDGSGFEINVPSQSVKYGDKITNPGSQNVTGYIFAGWYIDSSLTHAFSFSSYTMPASDVTLYAKWDEDIVTYNVYHYFQDVNGNYPVSANSSDVVVEELTGRVGTLSSAEAKNEEGFRIRDDFSNKILVKSDSGLAKNDIEIFYERKSYNLHFILGDSGAYSGKIGEYGVTDKSADGKFSFSCTIKYGAVVDFVNINPNIKDDTKYFAGWYTREDYTAQDAERWGYANLNNITMPDRDMRLYARWTDTPVWFINFETNGGSSVVAEEVIGGDMPTDPGVDATTRAGFTFDGWYSDATLSNKFNFDTPVNNNFTVYAKWIGNSGINYIVRNVKQNADGTWENAQYEDRLLQGTAGEIASYTPDYIEGFAVGDLPQVTIEGDGSTIIELKYSRNIHTVHFDLGGHGQQLDDEKVLYGAYVKQPTEEPSANGYSFEGWYKDADCTERYYWILNTMPDSDITLYAKWNFIYSYWIGPASKITSGNKAATANQPNPNYESAEKGYIKTEKQIDADVEEIRNGNTKVMAEYRNYMIRDNYHLYVKWNGPTDDAGGTNSENKWVEFRIVNIGSHAEDESALTFQAIHTLPHAYQMNQLRSNASGWAGSELSQKLTSDGEIYKYFETNFTDKIKAVSKTTTNGSKSAEVSSVSQKLWIPSYTEITGKPQTYVSEKYADYPGYSDDSEVYEGEQYYYFSQKYVDEEANNPSLYYTTRAGNMPLGSTDKYSFWWTRSPNVRFTNTYLGVYSGNPAMHAYANDKEGVVLAFCF